MPESLVTGKPYYRGDIYDEAARIFAWREWFRHMIPSPKEGYVLQDIDLLVRRFYRGVDNDGKFLLADLKMGDADLTPSQDRTFRLMDRLLRRGDPEEAHYQGFYVIQTPGLTPADCEHVVINGAETSMDDFLGHMKFEGSACRPRW